ncbi:MAG TPA: response regulator transcription factor [Prolixibacteraceae bacterium]|nr:response regulator transcription factor [Prolixibacteraceae bacterium]HPR85089.1 response regulator transcription factor [Prolixibacteraceae bacterium]
MIDIAIFDEHKLVLEGLSGLLSGISDFRVVLQCDDRSVLTEKLKAMQVHVLLLNMHDISVRNINLIVQLNISNPKLKILVISVIDSEEIVLKTIKAGAKGFLGKDSDRNSLMEAVYTLRNGHDYYSQSITHLLLNRYISSLKSDDLSQNANLESLSSRQVAILKLWGESYTNQEIADKFFISVRTVESHKNHIMQKLNLKSTVDMVKFAIKNNIIEI